MSSWSNYWEDAILNYTFRGVAMPSLPASLYVALYTVAPTDAGGGTEVTGGSYARVAVTRNTTNFTAPADNAGAQRTTNAVAITFPNPTANWGTVVAIGILDAATAGNLIAWAPLGTSRTINSGDTNVSFGIGALAVSQN